MHGNGGKGCGFYIRNAYSTSCIFIAENHFDQVVYDGTNLQQTCDRRIVGSIPGGIISDHYLVQTIISNQWMVHILIFDFKFDFPLCFYHFFWSFGLLFKFFPKMKSLPKSVCKLTVNILLFDLMCFY